MSPLPSAKETREPVGARASWASTEGFPHPLGVSWSEADRAYNFALYSKHATSGSATMSGASSAATRT